VTDLLNISPLGLAVAVLIAVLSAGRTARLIGFDEYPPMVWLRDKWDARFGDEGWGKLIHCPFCSAPYLLLGITLWFLLAFGYGGDVARMLWWFINGVWGFSYLSSILVAYDQPE
jgi:hypothetical protein